MNSANNLSQLSLIHPDDIYDSITHISNMPFDGYIDCYIDCYNNADYALDYYVSPESDVCNNTDYVSLETIKISSEYSGGSNSSDSLFDLLNINIKEPQTDMETAINENIKLQETLVINGINLGDGKMDYIENEHDKLMLTNAWQAITQTNTWNFVAQEIESFMWSKDPKIHKITIKMEELGFGGHSGCSFGYTMRSIQYLAQNGEEEFKKLFKKEIKNTDTIVTTKINKFLEYTGGS